MCLLVAFAGELGFAHVTGGIYLVAAGAAHAKVVFLKLLYRVGNGDFLHDQVTLRCMGLALVETALEWHFSELHAVSVNDVIVIRILVLLAQAIRAPADHSCGALTAQRRFGHFSKLHVAQIFDLLFLDACVLIGHDSHSLVN